MKAYKLGKEARCTSVQREVSLEMSNHEFKVRPVISLSFCLSIFSHSKQEVGNYIAPELGFARGGHQRREAKGVTGLCQARMSAE